MQTQSDSFLRVPQILELLPISRSTWWAWVKAGKAPPAIKVSPGVTIWRKSEVLAMVQREMR